MEWINYAVSILSGLAVAIPLVVKLVEYVKKAVKEKNWNQVLIFRQNPAPFSPPVTC